MLRKHGDLFKEQEKRVFRGIGNPKVPTVLTPFKGVLYISWLSLFWQDACFFFMWGEGSLC